MRVLNQLLTFLSGVIILTAFTFGVANANNRYAIAQEASAKPSAEAIKAEAEATVEDMIKDITKDMTKEKAARAE
ncbi:hypothetical protein, partial [Psychrobacter sp. S1-30-MNA-CIBAN-0213]